MDRKLNLPDLFLESSAIAANVQLSGKKQAGVAMCCYGMFLRSSAIAISGQLSGKKQAGVAMCCYGIFLRSSAIA
ncbi:MAG TPA: hypothetical protein P5121_28335, partial [Caldilineaceae bacterium]|nr:hypothetical protein [Caldilineaceae bacterium]